MVPPVTSFLPFTSCKRLVIHTSRNACCSSCTYCTFFCTSALLSPLHCCPAFWRQIRIPPCHISSSVPATCKGFGRALSARSIRPALPHVMPPGTAELTTCSKCHCLAKKNEMEECWLCVTHFWAWGMEVTTHMSEGKNLKLSVSF